MRILEKAKNNARTIATVAALGAAFLAYDAVDGTDKIQGGLAAVGSVVSDPFTTSLHETPDVIERELYTIPPGGDETLELDQVYAALFDRSTPRQIDEAFLLLAERMQPQQQAEAIDSLHANLEEDAREQSIRSAVDRYDIDIEQSLAEALQGADPDSIAVYVGQHLTSLDAQPQARMYEQLSARVGDRIVGVQIAKMYNGLEDESARRQAEFGIMDGSQETRTRFLNMYVAESNPDELSASLDALVAARNEFRLVELATKEDRTVGESFELWRRQALAALSNLSGSQ